MRVVRLGSAKAAADELALSPSALSRRISTLETFTGKRLFTRQHQAMKLTDAGRAFYDAVMPRLDALALAIDSQMDHGQVLRLRLGVPPLFGSQRLFPRLPDLRKKQPRLHIDIDTSANTVERVGETLDAAVVLVKQPQDDFHAIRLDRNRVYAIVSREMAAALGKEPTREQLTEQTFLVHNDLPESFDAWKAAIGQPDLEPAAVDHFDSGQLMLEAAAQGLGIAIMHDDHLKRAGDSRLATIYDREIESPYSYWFVCLPKDLDSRPVRLFNEWISQADL